mmetsp:Transcript_34504/g.84553  ORF Transcript_34504/g.84553 Transcript_34504/m.84553 type:complete len:393 (+) Transcript_34504:53-1231(+)
MASWPVLERGRTVRVCVTGGAGQIAYALLPSICRGDMLGADVRVSLRLLDIDVDAVQRRLVGVAMELHDCAFPLLDDVVCTPRLDVAFGGADVVIMLGAFPRKEGMLRKDLIKRNAGIFKEQGAALQEHAAPGVKVVVIGNPANTNTAVLRQCAPQLPSTNFTALTRLDQHRAAAFVASRAGVDVQHVKNVVVWGNHSATMVPDVTSLAVVTDFPQSGITSPALAALGAASRAATSPSPLGGGGGSSDSDVDQWISTTFAAAVRQRGAAIIAQRGLGSAASAARAIVEHVRSWLRGTAPGEVVSMGVLVSDIPSRRFYGIPDGVVFSVPVTCSLGQWRLVPHLTLNSWLRAQLHETARELVDERNEAFGFLGLRGDADGTGGGGGASAAAKL